MKESRWTTVTRWLLETPLLVALPTLMLILAGLIVHPFDQIAQQLDESSPLVSALPRDRVAVDAIPDLGENQQIVFTKWKGRSPKDVEDQVTYPLTSVLLGLPGVKSVRSSSMFGFSSIYVIFEDDVEFYWARSRILEKLSALDDSSLPKGATPVLGPDATSLGQVYWYTLEGRDPVTGATVGGWDLHETRSVQDWVIKPALQSTSGVSEVSSVGGYVSEFQVEMNPKKLDQYKIPITQVAKALRSSNRDVGARTLEINRVEYVVRGIGQLDSIEAIKNTLVTTKEGTPIRVGDLATVNLGPAVRRGALDLGGAEVVGGVVVARYGENPVEVIEALRQKLAEVGPSLPSKTLANGQVSQLTVVPFYDRSVVVTETLETLGDALIQQVLITIVVVLLLLGHLRGGFVISIVLPLSVLATFVLMRTLGVTANVMSLAGIAIAIGTMVDMAIVLTESMVAKLDSNQGELSTREALAQAVGDVAPAVTTSVLTTVLSFLPIFGLTASEGKLFGPLAVTKTLALLAALSLSLFVLPTLASWVLGKAPNGGDKVRQVVLGGLGVALWIWGTWWVGLGVLLMSGLSLLEARFSERGVKVWNRVKVALVAGVMLWWLALAWVPLGHGTSRLVNFGFVAGVSLGVLGTFWLFLKNYRALLTWALGHKLLSMVLPAFLVAWGVLAWRGAPVQSVSQADTLQAQLHLAFPGLGSEFMPAFDEGQFLVMPSVMPHASIGQSLDQLKRMDAAIMAIPEVEVAVGKLGRVESALDPAPVSMFETVVSYKPEWGTNDKGERVRQWRQKIRSTQDIWQEIAKAIEQPGLTGAPKLMPIQTRIIMLQSGLRAPMGLKIKGPDLESLSQAGDLLETALKEVPVVRASTVFAEQVVGKPYLEIRTRPEDAAQLGLSMDQVQSTIQIALGGEPLGQVIRGRERLDLSVRYARQWRGSPESLKETLVTTPSGRAVMLGQVADFVYVKGPQAIKSEDSFLTSYLTFDLQSGVGELEAVEQIRAHVAKRRAEGLLTLPQGVRFEFAGNYQNQVRSSQRLMVLGPVALMLILLVLYFQFRSFSTTLIVYLGVVVAVSGGFILMWFYQQPWFLDINLGPHNLRALFQVAPTNLSVAVWVGVIALVGIATDDGVVMATYLDQKFAGEQPESVEHIRQHVLDAGLKRIRPCLMTTATTLLALLPVVTSTGRGADVMIPMALPCLGGMMVELATLFVVPVLYCWREEVKFKLHPPSPSLSQETTP